MPTRIYWAEQRTVSVPGVPPMTVQAEITMRNGKGHGTLKIFNGDRAVRSKTRRHGARRHLKTSKKTKRTTRRH